MKKYPRCTLHIQRRWILIKATYSSLEAHYIQQVYVRHMMPRRKVHTTWNPGSVHVKCLLLSQEKFSELARGDISTWVSGRSCCKIK